MKNFLVAALCGLSVSVVAFAQPKKKMITPVIHPTSVTSLPAYYSPAMKQNEITGNFGLYGGAINLGLTYVRPMTDFGFGGYIFMQTSKDKNNATIVSGVTAFGALVKVNIFENHSIRAYVAPGFGMAMIKDGSQNGAGGKSDENLISPTFKIGVQYKATPDFIVGLERMQFPNWLNDSLNNTFMPAEYYTIAGTFEF